MDGWDHSPWPNSKIRAEKQSTEDVANGRRKKKNVIFSPLSCVLIFHLFLPSSDWTKQNCNKKPRFEASWPSSPPRCGRWAGQAVCSVTSATSASQPCGSWLTYTACHKAESGRRLGPLKWAINFICRCHN